MVKKQATWTAILLLGVLSTFSHLLLEWLFFVTKPSFLSVLSPGRRLAVLILSPIVPTWILCLAFLIFLLMSLASSHPS